jgi:hypothetical protein
MNLKHEPDSGTVSKLVNTAFLEIEGPPATRGDPDETFRKRANLALLEQPIGKFIGRKIAT